MFHSHLGTPYPNPVQGELPNNFTLSEKPYMYIDIITCMTFLFGLPRFLCCCCCCFKSLFTWKTYYDALPIGGHLTLNIKLANHVGQSEAYKKIWCQTKALMAQTPASKPPVSPLQPHSNIPKPNTLATTHKILTEGFAHTSTIYCYCLLYIIYLLFMKYELMKENKKCEKRIC